MAPFLDARFPVVFGRATGAGAKDALLIEGEGEPAPGRDWFQPDAAVGHQAGCACCAPRNGAGMALARLILARGRGTGLFFDRVIVVAKTDAGRDSVLAALEMDPLVSCVCKPA